jgi:pyruvate,orthophosphate dikinase
MKGHPVTIRLLDPPLHEFLPKREELMVEITKLELQNGDPKVIEEKKKLLAKVTELHEFNPMLGLRGCRLGIMFPEISEMQIRAIIEAAVEVAKSGMKVLPEIMIPLTASLGEMKVTKKQVVEIAEAILKKENIKIDYKVGTMIEIPRAALLADKIAEEAEFFSFGTNDLTQTTFGFSRDDAGKIINYYVDKGILEKDPFQILDQEGVGQLIKLAIEKGRSTRKDLKVGICGEHGGEPSSVKFCHRVGMNYVSCSPYRVPIARLAAAQAAIEEKKMAKTLKAKKSSTKKVSKKKK